MQAAAAETKVGQAVMSTVLDWIAYVIAGAAVFFAIAGCLLLITDSIRAIRKSGARVIADTVRDSWGYMLLILSVVGVVMFVIWRFER